MTTVLVVDDEEGLLEVIADVVAALGYVPLTAHDGAEALARAQEHRPDLILSDHMMPRLTGGELLRQVRKDPGLHDVPFILMSAASPGGVELATRFLRKPVDLDTLERAIREAVGQSPSSSPGKQPVAAAVPPLLGPRRDLLLWIGHEVRTPIAAARLNAEVLARAINGGDAANQARAQALVGQLAALTETLGLLIAIAELMDAGHVSLREEDLVGFVGDLAAAWRSRVPEAQVNVHAPARPLLACLDGQRIRHVMDTLLATSMRRVGTGPAIDLSVDTNGGGTVLRMTSNDTLPSELLNHPLDPDQLAHSGVEDPAVLPLYLAAVVTQAHKGTVVVNEEPDRRATVSLHFPAA
jgi:CheY-like chemotaxis protein